MESGHGQSNSCSSLTDLPSACRIEDGLCVTITFGLNPILSRIKFEIAAPYHMSTFFISLRAVGITSIGIQSQTGELAGPRCPRTTLGYSLRPGGTESTKPR